MTDPDPNPRLSVIVLTFNRWDMTSKLLESLLRDSQDYDETELVWVDNGSSDGTRDRMRRWIAENGAAFAAVRFRMNEENRGFILGVNDGLRVSTGEFVCLLNNDVTVPRGWASRLCSLADREGVGAVGPVSHGMPFQQRYVADRSGIEELPVVYGFCLVARRESFRVAGLLDERYGRGVVEVEDWCERVRRLGLRFLVDRDLLVRHDSPHASYTPRVNGMLTRRNEALFFDKWGRGPFFWGRPGDDLSFKRTVVHAARSELSSSWIAQKLADLDAADELLIAREHSDDVDHLSWVRIARKDPRLNVVCYVDESDYASARIARCAAANARSGDVVFE